MSVTRDSILSAQTIKTEAVDVPEFGGTVYLRSMNTAERIAFFDTIDSETDTPTRMGCKLIARCLTDASGARLLSDDDAPALEGMDALLIERLAGPANRVNGIDAAARAAAEKK